MGRLENGVLEKEWKWGGREEERSNGFSACSAAVHITNKFIQERSN